MSETPYGAMPADAPVLLAEANENVPNGVVVSFAEETNLKLDPATGITDFITPPAATAARAIERLVGTPSANTVEAGIAGDTYVEVNTDQAPTSLLLSCAGGDGTYIDVKRVGVGRLLISDASGLLIDGEQYVTLTGENTLARLVYLAPPTPAGGTAVPASYSQLI